MIKIAQFFGVFLLTVCISAVVMADGEGGVTQGPPAPAPNHVSNGDAPTDSLPPAPDSLVDGTWAGELITDWLLASIQ